VAWTHTGHALIPLSDEIFMDVSQMMVSMAFSDPELPHAR
jgi:hypothetical protein